MVCTAILCTSPPGALLTWRMRHVWQQATIIITMLFIDFMDTSATLFAMAEMSKMTDKRGNFQDRT